MPTGSPTRAFALGAVSGLRTFGALAPLGARGRLGGRVGQIAFPTLFAGELAGDKHPSIPARSDPPALGGRLAAGALAGRTVAGGRGAAVGLAGAAATTFLSEQARATIGDRIDVPDPVLGALEDALVIAVAAVASQDDEDGASPSGEDPAADSGGDDAADSSDAADAASRPSVLASVARGLIVGAVGTAAMTSVQTTYGKATGTSGGRAPEQVGRRFARRALGRRVPRRHRPALNQAVHFLYGTAWGVPLALRERRRPSSSSLVPGLALGAIVWAVSLGELPALDLAPAPWERSATSLGSELAFHLVYGAAAGAAADALGG